MKINNASSSLKKKIDQNLKSQEGLVLWQGGGSFIFRKVSFECQWGKTPLAGNILKPLEKAEAKDTNLVGIFKGCLESPLSFPLEFST